MEAVVVLGMHNSGTSLVVHMLGLLGGYVGEPEEVLQENSSYPLGYGERKDVIQMNNLLLASQELTCFRDAEKYSSTQVPPIQAVIFRGMMMRLTQLIGDKVKPPRFWTLKDPRLCLTFANWKESLKNTIKIICIIRDPRDVADSLFEKKKLAHAHTLALWQLYNSRLLANSQGYSRLLLRYEDLVRRPLDVLNVIQRFLGTHVIVKDEDLSEVIIPQKQRPPRSEPLTESQSVLVATFPSIDSII